jgi:hypothetical protein
MSALYKYQIQYTYITSNQSWIDDSPYYVFVALCIVVIVVSLIKIAASNENIECFREYLAVGYRAPDPSFFNSSCTGQDKKLAILNINDTTITTMQSATKT